MSANLKQTIAPDAAASDLWRVAETGDVTELALILPRVRDINVRNKYGTTALMRAAYHGHDRMVRALLDHGADPNLMRNDKFTALALAAFFGHTETVSILIEHGARTELVTRSGTSAQMWAKARTFSEVARRLESHIPAPAPVAPLVVKTLKDPPEIWDLVQEVPRGFDARSAFVARLKSMNGSFAFRFAAVLLLASVCVVGALVLRGSQARSLPPDVPSDQITADTKVSPPEAIANPNSESSVSASATEVSDSPIEANAVRNHGYRKVHLTRQSRSRHIAVADKSENVPSVEATATPATVATPQVGSRSSSKANSSLSPQLITPVKSAPKAKVIQWP